MLVFCRSLYYLKVNVPQPVFTIKPRQVALPIATTIVSSIISQSELPVSVASVCKNVSLHPSNSSDLNVELTSNANHNASLVMRNKIHLLQQQVRPGTCLQPTPALSPSIMSNDEFKLQAVQSDVVGTSNLNSTSRVTKSRDSLRSDTAALSSYTATSPTMPNSSPVSSAHPAKPLVKSSLSVSAVEAKLNNQVLVDSSGAFQNV